MAAASHPNTHTESNGDHRSDTHAGTHIDDATDSDANATVRTRTMGATWQPLLNGQAVTTNYTPLYLARNNPTVLYFLAQCPSSQALQPRGGGFLAVPHAGGVFGLCMSTDSGATWRTITAPSGLETRMQGGFIDPVGRFYTFVPIQVSTSGDPTSPENWIQEFWRYNPASRTWSEITQGPRGGVPLTATPTDANGGIAVWFVRSATGTGQPILYRYVI